MYKLHKIEEGIINSVSTTSGNIFISIPLTDPANTDYQQFKKDIMAGGELQDADGVVMSQADAEAFIANLP